MATESTNSTSSTPDAPPAPSPPSLPSSPPHSPPLSPPLLQPPSPPLSPPPSPPLPPPPSQPFSSPPPPSPSTPLPSTPPPPSLSFNPPSPPEVYAKNNEPPPPKSPETSPSSPSTNHPMQPPPTPLHPSPPSQDLPQNSPAPPIVTQPIYSPLAPPSGASEISPPSAPSNNSSLSGSPSSFLPSVPPPGPQLTMNPFSSSPTPSGTSPVLQLSPASTSSNDLSGKSQTDGGGLGTTGAVAIGVVFGFLFLGVIGLVIWWIRQHKKKVFALSGLPTTFVFTSQSDSSLLKERAGHESGNETPGLVSSKNWFSYEELSRVTNEFSESNMLGEGGFGSVFKGRLPDGREVAVKQLKEGASQGEREFRAEVETISRVHHRHLVSLVGYCISDKKRLLVYDYVPNNTLHFHLHGKGVPVLDWPTRVKIATGAARGIAYLHTDCHPRIVHRDIKSSNILLDNNFDAQVSDFGLARWVSDAKTHVTTRVMGTFGYMAPEYASCGKLSEKSDVFSFGVVLLELLTGRKPVDNSQPIGEQSLVEWAQPLLNHALKKEEFESLVDPRLENSYVHSEMCRMVEAAASCVRLSAHKRPKISRILRTLDDMASSDLSNKMMRVGKSETMDPAQKSAELGLFRKMAFCSGDYSTGFFMQDEEK